MHIEQLVDLDGHYQIGVICRDNETPSKIFALYSTPNGTELKIHELMLPCLDEETQPLLHSTYYELGLSVDAEVIEKYTGLIYIPKFLYVTSDTILDEYQKYFKLDMPFLEALAINKEPSELASQFLVAPAINSQPEQVPTIDDYDCNVIETNNSEKYRKNTNTTNSEDKILEMVQNRGKEVYRLARIEAEMETLREEIDKKLFELTLKRDAAIEKIDTFDECIRIFISGGFNG